MRHNRKIKMKLKVLHVITSMGIGGAEVLLANSLAKGGLQDYTDNSIALFEGTSWVVDRIDKEVKWYSLDYKSILSLPRVLYQLRKIIKENKIDIVHTHLTRTGFLTHLVLPKNVKHVHTIHTTYSKNFETGKTLLWIEKQLYFKSKNANIISLSDYTKDDFLEAVNFKGNIFVLNNFVNEAYFNLNKLPYPADSPTLKLIAVGTLKKLKNFEFLLEVFGYLKDYPITLDIFGDGNQVAYQNVIQSNNLKVNMRGATPDLPGVMAKYDLFIMPSVIEGFPLVLFEAMASGVPVMLSDIASLKCIVKENAIYFDFKAKEVADTLVSIFEKKIDINSLAEKARTYAEETVKREKYIARLLDIYGALK